MSRHYYDVFRLWQSSVREQALTAINLLERVAVFKSVFFKAGWARYEEARPGTLRLIPGEQIVDTLARDYQEMRPMFFGEAPPFRSILTELARIEQEINSIDK